MFYFFLSLFLFIIKKHRWDNNILFIYNFYEFLSLSFLNKNSKKLIPTVTQTQSFYLWFTNKKKKTYENKKSLLQVIAVNCTEEKRKKLLYCLKRHQDTQDPIQASKITFSARVVEVNLIGWHIRLLFLGRKQELSAQ